MNAEVRDLKLELLKMKVNAYFREVVDKLETGSRSIVVYEERLAESLDDDLLMLTGALVKVCGSYGATVSFPIGAVAIYDRTLSAESKKS